MTDELTEETIAANAELFENIRPWDWRALDAVYKQFQEIRLYYEFTDVDVDRYVFADNYRQVMISAREMQQRNLPPQSRTFVNTRFKYTHGFGITLTNVSDFTPQGLPDLLIKDIPPVARYPKLAVRQPRIYYGELTDSPVVANSEEEEFDYPQGGIAGMCDPPDYGKLIVYQFPKDERVLGTQQVETKIDQDSFLSGQLSLWDQRGSRVIRGNVLAIPVESTLIYVEPIYLQAETAAYPELRLVVVMHNDRLSYAETFGQALAGLLEQAPGGKAPPAAPRKPWRIWEAS